MKSNESIFYVYEHWRPDKDVCFYVGKGHGRRAYRFDRGERNGHYNRIADELARLGMCVEVRMVRHGMTEDEAFNLERERIAFWKSIKIRLVNLTEGGEGSSGFVYSDELRLRRSADMKAANARPETKLRRHLSAIRAHADPQTKEKHSVASKRAQSAPEQRKKLKDRMIAERKNSEKERARTEALKSTLGRPEVKAKKGAAMREVWTREGMAEKIAAGIKAAFARPEIKAKLGVQTKGSRWINDGECNRRLKSGEPLPDGWSYGKARVFA